MKELGAWGREEKWGRQERVGKGCMCVLMRLGWVLHMFTIICLQARYELMNLQKSSTVVSDNKLVIVNKLTIH